MLKIIFGDIENSIYHPPTYFDNQYEDEWITDPLSVEMIRDIDKSEVISAHLIESPVLGPISPKEISGGVKTLILMMFDDTGKIFNASSCGDNCAKWIVEIGKRKDLTINLHHVLDFSSGVEVQCEKKCRVLEELDWKLVLQNLHDQIIFLDEDNLFLKTTDFAGMVKESDNYFVIITREDLANLPYSVEEVYGIHTVGKYHDMKQVYNKFYHIYGENHI